MTGRRNDQICEINITPLTDIFLVLLIIMMVVAPTLNISGLNLAVLTVGDAPKTDTKPKVLKLEVNARGEFIAAKQTVGHDALTTVLKERATEFPDGVLVEVDPEAAHEAFTYALSCVVQAGIAKVGVVEKGGGKLNGNAPAGAGKGKTTYHDPKRTK